MQLGARCARVVAAGSMPENPSEVAGPIGVRDSSGCLCVAVCSSTCLQEWATLLRACGWRGSNDRLFELCNMIVSNDIFAWYQMGRGGDPGAWPGAQSFSASELHALRTLKLNGDQEPRHVLLSFV